MFCDPLGTQPKFHPCLLSREVSLGWWLLRIWFFFLGSEYWSEVARVTGVQLYLEGPADILRHLPSPHHVVIHGLISGIPEKLGSGFVIKAKQILGDVPPDPRSCS